MYKKMMSLFCVVVFSIFTASYVSSAYAKEESSKLASHPLKKLMINKKAFDDVNDLIIRTVSNLPECKKCPAAKNAAVNFEKAAKKLEMINKNLKYFQSDTDALEPNEKAAVLMIYKSIVDSALTTKMILENLIAPFSEGQMYKAAPPPSGLPAGSWVAAAQGCAAVIAGMVSGVVLDLDEHLCPRTTPEDECRAAGCSWCWFDDGTCDGVEDGTGQSQNPCCEYFYNESWCADVPGCTWTPRYLYGYCSSSWCPPSIAP